MNVRREIEQEVWRVPGREEGTSLIICGQGRLGGDDACTDIVMEKRSYTREEVGSRSKGLKWIELFMFEEQRKCAEKRGWRTSRRGTDRCEAQQAGIAGPYPD